ncbi:MAG TPA: SGNH/GDSL hydrolase family protein, partial [Actinomycetota bacterium]|nr:SGNH/GDSL hydrolase family protein [Actinomycetota bacterium]
FSYRLPSEGTYTMRLDLRDDSGAPLVAVTRDVVVQDFLIVSLGDSVASGEGVPDRGGLPPSWQDRQCHRSAWAGPAQSALEIERADPRTSVTFIHLACSGATIDNGVLGPYAGIEPNGTMLQPQIVEMVERTAGREVDAVTLSIGANDVEFSNIVLACFITPDCHEPPTGLAKNVFDQRLALLPAKFDALADQLAASPVDLPRERLYITEYFDPTRNDAGEFCDDMLKEDMPLGLASPAVGISAEEAEWASTDMLVRLNSAMIAAAERHSWNYLGGLYSRFSHHGYCADDRWIVQLKESTDNQGNKEGTIHPNVPGHATYAERIAPALQQHLYVDGDMKRPRAPNA